MIKALFDNCINWLPFHHEAALAEDKASHVFKIDIDKYFELIKYSYQNILNTAEIDKASRFLNHVDQVRYIVTKYVLRKILANFLAIPPSQIEFHLTANKKPAVTGIEFNVTHSKNLILIAVSTSPIGIDIEFINRNVNIEPLIETVFSDQEYFFMDKSPDKLIYFYMVWTRKEALLKATGEGLIDNLTTISILASIVSRFCVNFNVKSTLIDHQYIMSLATQVDSNKINYWSYGYI